MENQNTLPYHLRSLKASATEIKAAETHHKGDNFRVLFKNLGMAQHESRLDNLKEHLNVAMMLELSTIPPYLSALYTMETGDSTLPNYKEEFGDNAEASVLIRSVLMEEMLHLTLAGNVLNAIGGEPKINQEKYVPKYPTVLPDSSGEFLVHIRKFDKQALETFLKIEQPTPPHTEPKFDNYNTIGQFYSAIVALMEELEAEAQAKGDSIFIEDNSRQIDENYYYGGGGKIIAVTNLASAKNAIDVILEQGEGSQTTIYDTDDTEFDQIRELAHYFKFNEIYEEQRYAECQNDPKQPPQGTKMDIKYNKVYNMGTDLKTKDFPTQDLKDLSNQFNITYRELLDGLQVAFTGQQDKFIEAVSVMYKLKYKALELMRNPIPGSSENAGPTFEFLNDAQIAELTIEELNLENA